MGCWTVSRLAKECGLSRSALLHYDSLGLLRPAARSASGYRLYSEGSLKRLKSICAYREAGLPLEEIARLLAAPGKGARGLLRKRLDGINAEIRRLRVQQQLVMAMISGGAKSPASLCGKELVVDAMRKAGMSQEEMRGFHEAFEKADPKAHHDFLSFIGLSPEEIADLKARLKK